LIHGLVYQHQKLLSERLARLRLPDATPKCQIIAFYSPGDPLMSLYFEKVIWIL